MYMIGPWFGQGTFQTANDQLMTFFFLNLVFSLTPFKTEFLKFFNQKGQ